MDNQYDVIIVGSGFGGSVSALRLTEKGYRVLVIEKGKRFEDKDFPKTNWNLRKYLWFPNLFLYGIQCITFLKNIFILHGCGVGGGSLVYANTLLIPPSKAFKDNGWPDNNWEEKLMPHFDTAKKMLGSTPSPHLGVSELMLKECAEEMDRGDTFEPVNVGVYYGKAGVEEKDPYFNGEGPDRKGCILCGECMVGCRHNAKNTLVKNYLYLAEKAGATILPEREVLDINISQGSYRITVKKSTGVYHQKEFIKANKIILSGGVMGTVKLLLKCKQKGTLPDISDTLGNYVRTNSEAILGTYSIRKDKDKDYTRGVAISAGFQPDDNTKIETVRYGKGQDAMGRLATFMTDGSSNIPSGIQLILNILRHPIQFLATLWPFEWSKKSIIVLVMQYVDSYISLDYSRKWWRLGGRSLNSNMKSGKPPPGRIPIGEKVTKSMAEKTGGFPVAAIPNSILDIPTTAHILGGCRIGKNIESGVIDENLEAYNYPGMYIIDGSSIPANLGVNPSLTITALSEYAMSQFSDNNRNTNEC